VVIEPAVANEADHRPFGSAAFGAQRRRKGPAEGPRRPDVGLPGPAEVHQPTCPDAGKTGIGHEDPVAGKASPISWHSLSVRIGVAADRQKGSTSLRQSETNCCARSVHFLLSRFPVTSPIIRRRVTLASPNRGTALE